MWSRKSDRASFRTLVAAGLVFSVATGTAFGLLELARTSLYRCQILGRLRVFRIRPTQGIDITAGRVDGARLECGFPGDHPFTRNAVPNRAEIVDEVRAVDPIIIAEIRTDQATTIRAVTWGAHLQKHVLALREHDRIF